ncbi:MAG: nickel-dependent hydrogenase large subunit [Sedimentisphaeraceae bacterium JB056]
MPSTIKIDPVTRIEGHLSIEVTVDKVDGQDKVIAAKSSGTMFRGFERILQGHDAFDAVQITQRICGVCPVSHAMASSMALEGAFNSTPPANGRIVRNLVLGANFLQSHILHFYHLCALDYIDTTGILDIAPWSNRYVTPDMVKGNLAATLVNHYVQALEMRRKAHQMGAIFGGKLPCCASFAPGGCTEVATSSNISAYRALLSELRSFIDNVFIPDVLTVAGAFGEYFELGQGSKNLIAYGVFDLDSTGSNKLLRSGKCENPTSGNSNYSPLDITKIAEYVGYSKYSSPSGLNPVSGQTTTYAEKPGAYSWIKAPRYENKVFEAGPLARMWINGDYTGGVSAMDRIAARAYETKKVADAMNGWLNSLSAGVTSYTKTYVAANASGIGLTEAPRGAVGHWVSTDSSAKIAHYQILTPTAWNASPMDDYGNNGAMEQALIGTPVANMTQPIELLRVIHSFDPCLACSVHMLRPDSKKAETVMPIPCGV